MRRYIHPVLYLLLIASVAGCTEGEVTQTRPTTHDATPHAAPPGDDPAAWQTARYPSIAAGGAAEIYFTRPGIARGDEEDPEIDDAIAAAIDQAEERVDLCLFEFDRFTIVDAAVAAAQRGVQVRFAGDGDELHDDGYEALLAAGIELAVRKPGDRIMHNKFVLVDDRIVFVGSMNYSENGVMLNNNNTLRIDSPELSQAYTREFNQMYGERLFGRKKNPLDLSLPLPVGDTPVEVYFSPEDEPAQHLRDVLASAEHSALFMIFSYTRSDVAADMKALHDDGVQVIGIFDESQARSRYSQVAPLAQHGVPVYIDGNENARGFAGGKLHHKVLIVDAGTDSDPTVVTGSFNWSASANKYNDENMLILHGADFVAPFLEEFCANLEVATPHPDLANAPNDPCANLLTPLRINEVLANPAGSDRDHEFIEIVNTGGAPVNLTGWQLGDAQVPTRHVFGDVELLPRDVIVVYSGPAAPDAEPDPSRLIASTGYLGLANSTDEVVLSDPLGVVVDRISYRSAISGVSFNRATDGASSGAFVPHDTLGAPPISPGLKADGTPWEGTPRIAINELLPNPAGTDLGNEFIELVNVGLSPINLTGWTLSDLTTVRHTFGDLALAPGDAIVIFDRGDHSDVPGAILASTTRLSINNSDETITLRNSRGQIADQVSFATSSDGVSLNRATDGGPDGDFMDHDQLPGGLAASPGARADATPWIMGEVPPALLINELMINPDGSDRGNEYVEIVNVGTSAADLSGWSLGDAVNPERHLFEDGTLLEPGDALVIFDGGDRSDIPGAIIASSSTLSLNNTSDTITLLDGTGEVHDAVYYTAPPSDESLNRASDGVQGAEMVPHSQAEGATLESSPGVRIDGTPFL